MKPPTQMSDAELEQEVTELRAAERTDRKQRKVWTADDPRMQRITALALEQGNRWARSIGL